MINVSYTLHTEDGDTRYEERQCAQVPRAGELVVFDNERSYQVADVLWHVVQTSMEDHNVTVTACELDWHKHIGDVLQQQRQDRDTGESSGTPH